MKTWLRRLYYRIVWWNFWRHYPIYRRLLKHIPFVQRRFEKKMVKAVKELLGELK